MKKKVLYISHCGDINGAPRSMMEMIFSNLKIIESIVICPEEGVLVEQLKKNNISVYVVNFANDMLKIGTADKKNADRIFLSEYRAAQCICELVREDNISLVHTNTSVTNVGIYVALMLHIPHVWHIRELMQEDFSREYYDKMWKKFLFSSSQYIISISDCVAKKIENEYDCKTEKIYNGIQLDRYITSLELNRNHNILIAGVVDYGKGQWEVMRAVQFLIKKYPDIRLYIVGKARNTEKWYFEHYISHYNLQNNIFLIDFVNDLAEFRKKCMISITASRMEALGRVTLEAMLAGNIVIGAASGGTLEIIGESETRGILYEPGNIEQLSQKIEYVFKMSDSSLRLMQMKAQDFVVSNFDIIEYVKKINKVYDNVIDKYIPDDNILKSIEGKYELTKKTQEMCTDIQLKNELTLTQKADLICENNLYIGNSLKDNNVKTVGIYGMGYWGIRLYDNFCKVGLDVKFVIDQGKAGERVKDFINTYRLGQKIPYADILIVAVEAGEKDICMDVNKYYGSYAVMGISELINNEYNLII